MSGNRAQKSGFAAEAQAKMNAKYDEGLAREALEWVNQRITQDGHPAISTDGSAQNVENVLKDGTVLCSLMNAIDKSQCIKFKKSNMAFKQMETIGMFLSACEKFGVAKTELFQTVDLFEAQNLAQVILCIHALGRKVNTKFGSGGIGPKEAERNSRDFTEEQLKAGQNVIGLQMGSNKGANQSGQNFGKGRMIVD